MSTDLNTLSVFVAVAEAQGFRAAGRELGISGSAVSQAISRLEERLGIPLVERTTRSVRLTDAGRRLYDTVRHALEEVKAAEEAVRELGEEPRGTLRLNVSRAAESFLSGALLAEFLSRYPEIQLDLVVTEHTGEIVSSGYDAAIGLGEVIHQDMVALPVSGEVRLIVVGAPAYFETHPAPEHPRDLAEHVCINWRPGPDSPPYRWEFTEHGRDFSVSVDSRITTSDPTLNLRLCLAGVGLNMTWESWARPHIDAGDLVSTLDEYSPPFPGFYLYFPRRRQRSAALQALIDYVRSELRA
jgi:DNA-binding transcriptional LysR family regulator